MQLDQALELAISDELILACIDRAVRHRAADDAGVSMWAITKHLGIGRRSVAARHVRLRLVALEEVGRLAISRPHGVSVWVLTRNGRQRLRRARHAGNVPELPESPQHRHWRDAHALAAEEIERFRQTLGGTMDEAARMLGARPAVPSDAWFETSERLRWAAWRLGSASYCLYEWVEPEDKRADIDDRCDPHDEELARVELGPRRMRRAGRRNIRLWLGAAVCSGPGAAA